MDVAYQYFDGVGPGELVQLFAIAGHRGNSHGRWPKVPRRRGARCNRLRR